MTEVVQDDDHAFVMESGTEKGAAVLAQLPHSPAADALVGEARRKVADCAGKMGRSLKTAGLKTLLYENMNHERWQHVADRCLTCGNCTMVCPTCFCTTVEDTTGLDGQTAERWRKWDSCFTLDFAYIHGGSVRTTARSRYRQWMTHKLASWEDQFGRSGCVGCGRCITWCPVGIDITEEVAAMRGGSGSEDAESTNKEHDNGDTEP